MGERLDQPEDLASHSSNPIRKRRERVTGSAWRQRCQYLDCLSHVMLRSGARRRNADTPHQRDNFCRVARIERMLIDHRRQSGATLCVRGIDQRQRDSSGAQVVPRIIASYLIITHFDSDVERHAKRPTKRSQEIA